MEENIMAQYAFDRAISVAATYVGKNEAKKIEAGQLAFWADKLLKPAPNLTAKPKRMERRR
jgi:hypothetical protein